MDMSLESPVELGELSMAHGRTVISFKDLLIRRTDQRSPSDVDDLNDLFADHYLVVQRWHLDFDPFNEEFKKIVVSERVLGLPIEFYNKKFLWKVGDRLVQKPNVGEEILGPWMFVHESLYRRGSPSKFSSGFKGKEDIDRVGLVEEERHNPEVATDVQAMPQQKDGFPRTFAKMDKPKRGVVSGSKKETNNPISLKDQHVVVKRHTNQSPDPRSSKPPEEYGSMNLEIARPVKPSVEKEIHMEVDNQGI
ncbi:hypothetical protein Patl1_10876 [Pistacia atlantica]|uniref:Uncharacterized protein n=1 Tax=Pistacia atlantica TaxID=434234 RepID=A0ACC1A3Y0_9ROSI|nr:hypothetical protein Patl1_10876 [Pistacia atlantica]